MQVITPYTVGVFSIEKWSPEAHAHFFKHYRKGMLIIGKMPTDTFDQRVARAKRANHFYMRCKIHVQRMHPDLFS